MKEMKENKNAEWCLNEYEEYLKTMENYFQFSNNTKQIKLK